MRFGYDFGVAVLWGGGCGDVGGVEDFIDGEADALRCFCEGFWGGGDGDTLAVSYVYSGLEPSPP